MRLEPLEPRVMLSATTVSATAPSGETALYAEAFEENGTKAISAHSGRWGVHRGRYFGIGRRRPAISVLDLSPQPLPEAFRFAATVRRLGRSTGASGLVFDFRSPADFKVAGPTGRGHWVIGSMVDGAFEVEAEASDRTNPRHVEIVVDGAEVRLELNGVSRIAHHFDAPVHGGALGLAVSRGVAWFDDLAVHGTFDTSESTAVITIGPGDDLRAAIESAGDGTTIMLSAGTHHLSAQAPFNQGAIIDNVRDLTITGQGWADTKVKLAPDVHFGFYMGSNVERLTIERLHIEGTTPLAVNTHGIGNFSGTSNVRHVTFTELKVSDIAIGIALDTFDGGVYDGVTVTHNLITDTQGTDAGWGYGVEMTNARNVVVAHNTIENATRHSIYVARSAPGANILIERNRILEHDRDGIQPRWFAAAISISRASSVKVAHNVLLNPRAIGISIERDDILGRPVTDITLLNNHILNAWYVGIWVTTGQTHTALGNRVVPRTVNATPNPQWHEPVSFFDFPRGVATSSGLAAPLARWEDLDDVAEVNGKVYTLRNGVVDEIVPYAWTFRTAVTQWTDATGLIGLQPAPGQTGTLVLKRGFGVYRLDTTAWTLQLMCSGCIVSDPGP